MVNLHERYGFIDLQGKLAIPCQFENAEGFSEGLAAVYQNGRWGFIDLQGKLVIPYQFEGVGWFSEGLAAVSQNGRWGFIDPQGKLVIPYQFEEVWNFSNGLAMVSRNDKWGVIDSQGKMVIPCWFDSLSGNDIYKVVTSERFGESDYLNKDGSWLICPRKNWHKRLKFYWQKVKDSQILTHGNGINKIYYS